MLQFKDIHPKYAMEMKSTVLIREDYLMQLFVSITTVPIQKINWFRYWSYPRRGTQQLKIANILQTAENLWVYWKKILLKKCFSNAVCKMLAIF